MQVFFQIIFVYISKLFEMILYALFSEIMQTLKTVVRQSGISGLWLGLSSTLLRDVPFSAIYWLNYEAIKQRFYGLHQTFTFNLIAGAIAGSVSILFHEFFLNTFLY